MTTAKTAAKGLRFSLFQGLSTINGSQIPTEIIAGITLAALAIPEVMGYTKIAGTPVVTGLYTILIPMTLFAIFGSSRHLVVGADFAMFVVLLAQSAATSRLRRSLYPQIAADHALRWPDHTSGGMLQPCSYGAAGLNGETSTSPPSITSIADSSTGIQTPDKSIKGSDTTARARADKALALSG
jgi:hypothetical protein